MNSKSKIFKFLGLKSSIIVFRFLRALRTLFISVAFILVYIKLSNGGNGDIELHSLVFSFTLGTTIAILRDLIVHSRNLGKLSILLKWSFQWVVIILTTILFWFLLIFVFRDLNPSHLNIFSEKFLHHPQFFLIIQRVVILSFFIITYVELENRMGKWFLFDILFQRNDKAKVEERLFLFMDLNDSTSINEKMGNKKYYEFINTCYYLMSDAILQSGADIVKYVGDEVILTWKTEKSSQYFNALLFFELFKVKLKKQESVFQKKFGEIPSFKAGMHIGEVVKAEVGYLKKQKDFYGDVMNITARILGKCELYQTDFLISEEALFFLTSDIKSFKLISDVQLKGRFDVINIYSKYTY